MLGSFQQSQLRIEITAPIQKIRDGLICSAQLQQWLAPQRLDVDMPDELVSGLVFKSTIGPVVVQHQVEILEPNYLRLILSQGIDGYHEWYWGDGWLQSRLEGISLLPLNLGQTLSLLRFKNFLAHNPSP
jgi:hypothetical protein